MDGLREQLSAKVKDLEGEVQRLTEQVELREREALKLRRLYR